MTSWIPLHLHSQYSILSSTLSIHTIVERAKKQGLSSCAITDSGNLFGAVDFFKECQKASIHPIIGCQLFLAPTSRHEKRKIAAHAAGYPLILIAKNRQGYRSLCKLSSIAYSEGFYYTPRIDKELLEQFHEGLICLPGNFNGYLGSLYLNGQEELFHQELCWFASLFGEDLYLPLQRHHASEGENLEALFPETWLLQLYHDAIEKESRLNGIFLDKAKQLGVETVATHQIHYLDPADWLAHELLMNVQSGETLYLQERDRFGKVISKKPNPKREVLFSKEHYFISPQQMAERFCDQLPSIEATVRCAEKCQFTFDFGAKFYPVFTPEGFVGDESGRKEAAAKFLTDLCYQNIPSRYTEERLAVLAKTFPGKEPLDVVKERLVYELDIILSKGMGDYLLIVYDFIAWAKKQGIPMGPGRGSGAGSIVLFLIGITDIEPLRFHLFFERFINPERLSYPDIDVDICMERRGEVIEYTLNKYGKDRVAQIITFGTMKAKMAVKDVGRVLDVPLAKVNEIAKLIPDDLAITIEKALEIDADLKALCESDKEVKLLLELARKLEGSVRNTGIHAAGLIVCADPLTDHIPLCLAKDSEMLVTQYAMKPVESVGMLKIDFLGLKTLTCVQKCADLVQATKGIKIDWVNLPLDDKVTYALLNQGKTSGIFQLESSGMQELAKHLHIDRFEEIIAVAALYRPGPMDMIPSFIQRKHGKEAIEYDHPWMEEALKETYGIMVYQEQVMQMAQKLAGYSLGEGDVLRRAMGKKDHKEMSKQREKFLEGARKQNIDEAVAMLIFDKIEKFASYGFNKSHAAAYGYLSYVTAYFKSNYPQEWMAALMSVDHNDLDKVAKHIRESASMNIAIMPPDVNESLDTFSPAGEKIRFGLAAIKGLGDAASKAILEARATAPYQSLEDFLKRLQHKKLGKKSVELLIDAGAFDFLSQPRAKLKQELEHLFPRIVRQQKEEERGVIDFFEHLHFESIEEPAAAAPVEEDALLLLKKEKELLGFYLTGHPLDLWWSKLSAYDPLRLSQLSSVEDGKGAIVLVTVESMQIKISNKSQRKFATLFISDGQDNQEVALWPEVYDSLKSPLTENDLLLLWVQVDHSQLPPKLNVKGAMHLSDLDESRIAQWVLDGKELKKQVRRDREPAQKLPLIEIRLDLSVMTMADFFLFTEHLMEFSGANPCEVSFWREAKKVGKVRIGRPVGINPASDLVTQWESVKREWKGLLGVYPEGVT